VNAAITGLSAVDPQAEARRVLDSPSASPAAVDAAMDTLAGRNTEETTNG
jgi:hypothetical protein